MRLRAADRRRCRVQLRRQVRTNRSHRRNDHDGNAGRDEAIFNGRRTRLILQKTRNELVHRKLPLEVSPNVRARLTALYTDDIELRGEVLTEGKSESGGENQRVPLRNKKPRQVALPRFDALTAVLPAA